MFFRGKGALTAVTLLCVLCLIQGCQSGQSQQASGGPEKKRQEARPAPIAVAKVETGIAKAVYTTTATLEAEHHASILARTTGVALELLREEGDTVEKGDVLLVLEDDDEQLRVKQAKLKLSQVNQEFQRRKRMLEAGVLSEQEFEAIENQLETAQAELEVAQLALSYTVVRAPFSGRIVRRHVQLGAQVTPGAQLYELMDVTPLLAKVYVPANRMGRTAVGQVIELKLDSSGQELEGKISLVSPIVDPETGTVKITCEIHEYPEGIRPGDFTEARLITDRREGAMLAPSIAIFEEQGKQVLFVASNGVAERREVKLGYIESGVTEVLEGVTPDDMIVIKGQRNLRDGMKVEVLEGPDKAQSLISDKKAERQGVGA